MARAISRRQLDVLVRLHLPSLLRFAVRLTGSVHDAEDATQETLLRISKSWQNLRDADAFQSWVEAGGGISLVSSMFALIMMAGTIIAAERADRSSEFLAYLPPARSPILLSKAIVLGGSALLALIVGGGGGLLADWLSGGEASLNVGFNIPLLEMSKNALLGIGVGWCASAHLANTGPSVGLAFIAPLAVAGCVYLSQYIFGVPTEAAFGSTFLNCCTAIGLTCLVFGSVYFIRRVEP